MPINGKMPNSINMETTAIKRFSLLIMTLIFLTSCVEEKDFKIIKDEVRKKSEYVMFYMVYDYDVYLESANVYVSENSDMSDCNKYAAGVERRTCDSIRFPQRAPLERREPHAGWHHHCR